MLRCLSYVGKVAARGEMGLLFIALQDDFEIPERTVPVPGVETAQCSLFDQQVHSPTGWPIEFVHGNHGVRIDRVLPAPQIVEAMSSE